MDQEKKLNIIGFISHFFTVHRPLSLLLFFIIIGFGLLAFFVTPKQYNPEIVRPAFLVTLTYQGATIEQTIDRVVYEIAEKIDTVPGVDDIYTQVTDGAEVTVTVIFEVGYDATKAKLDLLSQIEQHDYLAQGFISQPSITEINPETIPVLQVAFTDTSKTLPELRDTVLALSHELGAIEEVSETAVFGGYDPALMVVVDPAKMAAHSITFAALQSVLAQSQAREVYTGIDTGVYQIGAVFDGRVQSPEAIGALMVSDGVLVRDVASVYTGPQNRSYILHTSEAGSGEVVMLSVAKREGSSAPVITQRVRHMLDTLIGSPSYDGLEYVVVGDDGATASEEIFGLTKNLLTSIGIVAVVLFLFLSVRAAFVVLIAIPLTLLVVFGLGLLFDQTINRITLFALILSLGLLVDSAIVVVENIHAHLRQWRGRKAGLAHEMVIAHAVHEIGVGLLLSTVTSVIVFLPMRFITGMMGPYMGPIAFFVPVTLIVSLLIAVIITPFLASYILDPNERHNRLNIWFDARMQWLTQQYQTFLRSVLYSRRKQRLILRTALGLFLMSLFLPALGIVHFQMLPKADLNQFYVYVDLPAGTSIETTKEKSIEITKQLLEVKYVESVQQFVGTPPIVDFNGMFKGAQSRVAPEQATLRVNLTAKKKRKESSTDIVHAARTTLQEALPYAEYIRLMEEPPGPPVQATLVAKIHATDATDAAVSVRASDGLRTFFNNVSGVVDVYDTVEDQPMRPVFIFDHTRAGTLGISPEMVAQELRLLSGVSVVEYIGNSFSEYTPIIMQFTQDATVSPAALLQLPLQTKTGEIVTLGTVLSLQEEARPAREYFEDVQQMTYVTAEVEGRSIVYVVIDSIRGLVHGDLPGYTVLHWGLFEMELQTPDDEVITLSWGGEWEMTLENFRDLGIAMGVALLLVYAVLVAQYNQFARPAYILVTIPLGLIGILWGFLFLDHGFGIYLTATALIGFIALIGLVVNNAIIFLEYVQQAQHRGIDFTEALLAAGTARLRPIFLTSLTTILGSLTIVNDPVWSGLAWAIVFGLSLSTILTLVMYPTLLVYFHPKDD